MTALTHHLEDGTAWITIDDGKANAFDHSLINDLGSTLHQYNQNQSCRSVIISGRPRFLSAGFNLDIMKKSKESAVELVEAGGRLMLDLYQYPKPMILVSTGHAMAMGAIFLFAADYRLGVSGQYKIGLNESAIGLSLPWIAIELAKDKLARKELDRVIAAGEIFDPHKAQGIGFYDEVCDEASWKEAAKAHAQRLSELDGPAFAENKRRLRFDTTERLKKMLEDKGGFW